MADFTVGVLFRARDLASRKMGRLTRSFNKLGESAKVAGKRIGGVGKTMSLKLTLPISAFGVATVKAGTDFRAAMNMVGAVTKATSTEFVQMDRLAKQLGATTQFSASQAAEGMKFLGMAGLETDQIIGAIPRTLELAASAQMDLGTAADIVTNIMSGFRMEVGQLVKVNDVLVNAFTGSNTNLQELGQGMKKVGPVASALEFDFAETAASLGILASNAIKAEEGGTALRRIMSKLAAANPKVTRQLRRFGIELRESDGSLKSMAGVITEFEDAIERTGKKQAITNLIMNESLFGQRGGPAFLALLGAGSVELRKFTKELDEQGTAARVATAQMKGLPGAFKLLVSAFEAFRLAIIDSGVGDFVDRLVRKFAAWLQWMSKTNPTILAIGAAIAALLALLGPIIIGIGALVAAIGAIATVGAPVLAIIGAITGAVIGLGAAITSLVVYWDEWKEAMADVLEYLIGIGDKISGIFGSFMGFLGNIGSKLTIGGAAAVNQGAVNVRSQSETDINVRVTTDGGSRAAVEGVHTKKGDANVRAIGVGYVGHTAPAGG